MSLDLSAFTPWASLAGGLLIGAAASLLWLGTGRIAGISGLIGAALQALRLPAARRGAGQPVRLAFLAGLAAAPWLWQAVAPLPAARSVTGTLGLVAAGLLVGVGVRLGKGCTSGHGVCGLARGSLRSLVNVACFMGTGVLTVWLLRQFA